MSHARWVTTANRLCRLYVATPKPSQPLKDIVRFIVRVYAPSWFRIKKYHSCVNGTQNLYEVIKSCRYLKGEQKAVVQKSIQNNAYFAHPENLILGMIFDKTESIRTKAISLINDCSPKNVVRKFEVPLLNFNANSCYGMTNLNDLEITVPPLLINFNTEVLTNLYKSEIGEKICEIPCHSQAVERSVKLVMEAASSVTDKNRHGLILNKLLSRQKMPKLDNKNNFILN